MKNDDRYQKVITALKNNEPVLNDREKLTDEIMNSIRKPAERDAGQESMLAVLFGWSGNYWLRGAMAAVASVFVVFFIIQQVSLNERLNRIEDQLVRTENTLDNARPEFGTMQKVLLNMVVSGEDSITVSRSDLEELMNSYLELQENDAEPKGRYELNPELEKRFRKKAEKSLKSDES